MIFFQDGSVLYQKLTLAGDLISCQPLQSLTSSELNDLLDDVDDIQYNDAFTHQSSLVTCDNSGSSAPDWGVDNYRAATPQPHFLLPLVLDNLSCQGYPGSAPIKTILDDYWEIAPR